MKLAELAEEYNLDKELLIEVCEEDLDIRLPGGIDTDLPTDEVKRLLACDGLETTDGQPFAPIIAEEFELKHKRSLAAKKAAATRRRKEQQKELEAEAEREARLAEERRKHEQALKEREAEDEERRLAEEEAARKAEEAERLRVEAEEFARHQAEEEARRREEEARRLSEELARLQREAQAAEAEAARSAAAVGAATAAGGATAGAEPSSEAPAPSEAPMPSEADTGTAAETPSAQAMQPPAPVAEAPSAETGTEAEAPPAEADATATEAAPAKPTKAGARSSLGSKLAGLAKATARKADHAPKPEMSARPPTAAPEQGEQLSAEDRRKIIQDNIRRNLAMQQRVTEAKARDRKGRRAFRPIDNRGRAGAGGPPGPGGPGGPGAGRGGRGGGRDRRSHRADKREREEQMTRRVRQRRTLSTEEEDLSGKTEFTVALPCTVRDFSEASGLKSSVVIAKLFMAGVMANINSNLDRDTIELLGQEFDKQVSIKEQADVEEEVEALHEEEDNEEDLAPRPPVMTILGHVDHGKTSLLDAIRKTHVTEGEAGGITQHVGAYTVETPSGLEVTFIDTPGHEAFTEMRARGAHITDIAVIVIAADDGVMPQTIEAINHAKAAGVSLVVAMNKVDKDNADREKVLRQLSEQGLLAEEWGGDIGVIPCSAITGEGIDDLLERLSLESEVLELQANHFARASGTVIEANLSEGRGVTATLLVQRGSLAVGDILLAGSGYGRVRQMLDWTGEPVKLAGPSHAVEVTGLSELPGAGARFHVMEDLKTAANAADQRQHKSREKELAARNTTTTLASLFEDLAEAKKKELRLILKADAAGSLEVVSKSLVDIAADEAEVKVNIIHSGVGCITTGDITLAEASDALVIGFHVIADAKARRQAEDRNVEINTYSVIYEMLDDVKLALSGMLDPEMVQETIGHAEVRAVFRSSKAGTIAGLYVTDGKVLRDCRMRLTRDGMILHEGKVNTLRRFKENVREVRSGYECGLTLEGWNDVRENDLMEFYTRRAQARTL